MNGRRGRRPQNGKPPSSATCAAAGRFRPEGPGRGGGCADEGARHGQDTTFRQRADAALTAIAGYMPDLDAYLELVDRVEVLMEFGVTVSVHGEDVDDLEESYRHILEQAELTGVFER